MQVRNQFDAQFGGARGEKIDHFLNHGVQIATGPSEIFHADARESQEFIEDILESLAFSFDGADLLQSPLLANVGAFGKVLGEQLQVEPNGAKRVLDLV